MVLVGSSSLFTFCGPGWDWLNFFRSFVWELFWVVSWVGCRLSCGCWVIGGFVGDGLRVGGTAYGADDFSRVFDNARLFSIEPSGGRSRGI